MDRLCYSPLSYSLAPPASPIDHPSLATTYDLDDRSAKISTWIYVTFAYSFCGAATTASYFAALTASTKLYGSSRPALSVAGPSTLFGLSPLILSFLGVKLFSNPAQEFNSSGYLSCLAILTTVVNLFGAIGLACNDIAKEDTERDYESHEHAPLLGPSSPPHQTSPLLPQPSRDYESHERAPLLGPSSPPHQTSPLLPQPSRPLSEPPRSLLTPKLRSELHSQGGTREFLKTPTVWLLGTLILLSAGPAEMTISSIGFVVDSDAQRGPQHGMNFKARQVQLISLANTSFRLLSGWASDRFCGSKSGPRLGVWATGCLVYSLLCFSFGYHPGFVPILSAITGCFYGMIFTIAPSLVATVWSIDSFGRNYGIISYFSATGSFMFTFLFGVIYTPSNPDSIRSIYRLSGFAELASIFVILFLYRRYWSHQVL